MYNKVDNSINNVSTIIRLVMFVETKLQKWGNSDGIRIPKSFLKALNLKTNDLVGLKQDTDCIIISKAKNSKISLEERFAQYDGENLAKEFKWDESVGKEIW